MKKRCLFFILSAMLYVHGFSQNYISGNLFNSEILGVFGNVDLKNANIKNSSGIIQVSSLDKTNEINVTKSDIEGTIDIAGNYDTSINLSKKSKFGTLKLNKKNGSDLDLFGDSLIIREKMQLESGRIWNNDIIFQYDNPDPSSINFNDHSYIIGEIFFKVSKDVEYNFPVGDDGHLHLLKFKDNNSPQNLIRSCFCEGLPQGIIGSTSQYSNHGYWELLASNETKCTFKHYFKPMNLLLQNDPSILQLMEIQVNVFEEIFHPAYQINYNEYSLSINADINNNISRLVIVDTKEMASDDWINFISLSSGSDTHYIIPNLNIKYSNIKISIYNNWGNRIFKSENYRNEFDAREYPEGTYYYQAVYILNDGGQQMVKNGFFEIKN